MRAGLLNRRVQIQRKGPARDDAGQPMLDNWVDVTPPIWASIKHKSGMETIRADMPTSLVQASVRIRFREDVDATMRLVHGSTAYMIEAVLPDVAGRQFVDLICQLVPARAD